MKLINNETIKRNNIYFKNIIENDKYINNLIYENEFIENILNEILETINNYNISLYNIEIEKNYLKIRLNNLMIENKLKIEKLNNLINELNNYINVTNYLYENYLYIIEIEINF